jgi:hypothetical protein
MAETGSAAERREQGKEAEKPWEIHTHTHTHLAQGLVVWDHILEQVQRAFVHRVARLLLPLDLLARFACLLAPGEFVRGREEGRGR